jgi:hypothetical protein
MVLLDLQKAFDTVDHNILGEKLKVIGVESVSWFKSYLTNRKHIVSINGVNSDVCLFYPNVMTVYCLLTIHGMISTYLTISAR